jgi:hypothetical protein
VANQLELNELTLLEVLKANADSLIGREYEFDSITSEDEYRQVMPLSDYYQMKKYLDMIYESPETPILTADPVIWYLMTSGSTGKPKHLPLTESGVVNSAQGTGLSFMGYLLSDPENLKAVDGKLITFGAAAILDHKNGIPVGYASGMLASRQNKVYQLLISPGADVFNISDMEEKMWEYAKIMVKENVTGLQGVTTLSLALVRRIQNEYGPRLLEHYKGTKYERRLLEVMDENDRIDVGKLWPNMRFILASGLDTTPYNEWVERTFPNATMWEMYAGTEALYAGQFYPDESMYLRTDINHFEFIPESEADKDRPTVLKLEQVEAGKRYEIVITNIRGYYRYRPGDVMTIASTYPYTVKNIGRRGGIVNMSGEKLSEAHVTNAMDSACRATGAEVMDYAVVGHVEDGIPYYTIAVMFRNEPDAGTFLEAFEADIKKNNEEFRIVREIGSLGPTTLARMSSSAYDDKVRDSHIQAKPVTLTTDISLLEQCEEATA